MSQKLLAFSVLTNLLRRRHAVLVGVFAAVACVATAAIPSGLYAQTVSFAGVQTTVPASGLVNPYFVAVDGAGDVFIADAINNRVVEVPPVAAPRLRYRRRTV